MSDYLTVRQAARIADVSVSTVRRWLDEGKITKHQRPVNGRILVRKDEWLKKTTPVVPTRT